MSKYHHFPWIVRMVMFKASIERITQELEEYKEQLKNIQKIKKNINNSRIIDYRTNFIERKINKLKTQRENLIQWNGTRRILRFRN